MQCKQRKAPRNWRVRHSTVRVSEHRHDDVNGNIQLQFLPLWGLQIRNAGARKHRIWLRIFKVIDLFRRDEDISMLNLGRHLPLTSYAPLLLVFLMFCCLLLQPPSRLPLLFLSSGFQRLFKWNGLWIVFFFYYISSTSP